MKRKIFKFVSITVIAVAMMVSFQMSKVEKTNDYSLKDAQALRL